MNSNNLKETDRQKRLTLRVQKAKKRDIGRNIVRIDIKIMEELNIQTGDVISILGKKESAGIAWPHYPKDKGLGIIRIDLRLRKNTGTAIDDTLEVRKAKVSPAQSVVLKPLNVKIKVNPKFDTFVKTKLNNYPVSLDDYIYISIGISREIAFKIISIKPNGICLIKPETQLHISEHISDEEEKGGEYVTYEDVEEEEYREEYITYDELYSTAEDSDSSDHFRSIQILEEYYETSPDDKKAKCNKCGKILPPNCFTILLKKKVVYCPYCGSLNHLSQIFP